MTVEELIKELEKHDPKSIVFIHDDNWGDLEVRIVQDTYDHRNNVSLRSE